MAIEIDTKQLDARLIELADALGTSGKPADLSDIVRDEVRRAVIEIVRLLPPQTQQIGENAVRRDINSTFSGASTGMIDSVGSECGVANIDTYRTVAKKPLHIIWKRLDMEGQKMKAAHYGSLDRRGHAPKRIKSRDGEWRARNVVPNEAKEAYLKQALTRVGRLKASAAATAVALGVTQVSRFIRRHIQGGNPKAITHIDGLMNGSNPSATFGSMAIGVSRFESIWRSAVRIRSEAIAKRIKLIVSGYNRDLSRHMKIQAREKRSGNGGRYAIG